jgi:hypothetical protein
MGQFAFLQGEWAAVFEAAARAAAKPESDRPLSQLGYFRLGSGAVLRL